jgi:hypothetical protein
VHARAQVDQPVRPFDQAGHQVGREHVDREDLGQAVRRLDPPHLTVADSGVVDDRVEAAGGVGLFGDLAHSGQVRQVPDEHAVGLRQGRPGVVGPGLTAGV